MSSSQRCGSSPVVDDAVGAALEAPDRGAAPGDDAECDAMQAPSTRAQSGVS
jgi:hypothetical protein